MGNPEERHHIEFFDNIYIFNKRNLCTYCIYGGFLIAYLGSLNPWFMWPLGTFYIIAASFLLCISILLAASLENNNFFTSKHYLLPTIIHAILSYYLLIINGGHIGGFIFNLFNISIFFALFWLNINLLKDISTFLSKAMATLLAISIAGFFLYLAGIPLPSTYAEFAEGFYSYENYFLFMVDDRTLTDLFPRFHSVFLEPGHMGTACVLLLLTQCGEWKKWYNVILLIATIISFSLAAYVLLIITIFLNLWVMGKHFIGKLIITSLILITTIIGSFYYNDGDNLIHNLIVLRLEIYDGDIVGNNRVSKDFETEFQNFIQSSDIFTGRDMPKDLFGNSGYKVFLYENGIIGVILIILLYTTAMWNASNWKALSAAVVIAILTFIARGYPLWFCNFIPLYIMAYWDNKSLLKNKTNTETE